MQRYLTPIEIKSVDCPRCGAAPGERCLDARQAMGLYVSRIKKFHQERKEAYRNHERSKESLAVTVQS